jgi:class 3 adenylate cyclase
MPSFKIPKIPDLSNLPDQLKRPFPPFGELVREHRTLRGLTIEQLAEAVEITPSALREIESGTRKAPGISIAKKMAEVLHLDKDDRDTFLDSAEWDSSVMGHLLGRPQEKKAHPPLLASILVFLIADIRGYTHFTQEHGDQAAARLTTRFAEIAHAVVEQWGGQLIEVRGDEILAVFSSAQQSLKAANDLQSRCLQESNTHPDLPLTIGVGLDVGEAAQVEGGYRGAALNRAARLCSLAGGGEILVSTGVAYVAPQVDGVMFVPRGQEQLKGFAGLTPILLASPVKTIEASVTTVTTVTTETTITSEQEEPGE